MINGKDIYDVLSAIVPLYVAMILAYGSVRWWHIFTPDQCSGINRFVAVFAVPLLSFHFISTNNPYAMNYHFIAADSLQKVLILSSLAFAHRILPKKSMAKYLNLDWSITLFSLSSLPNTLVMGIPLLKAMYGDFSGSLMVQIVVLQSVIWYTLMLFMFEYRGAKALIADQFPADIVGSIASFRVDSDVMSLNGRDPLQADAEIGADGKVHVLLRRSTASSSLVTSSSHNYNSKMTPRASNLTGVEIYSLQSSREPTPRSSSFNQTDFYAMFASKVASPSPNPNGSGNVILNQNLGEEVGVRFGKHRGAGSRSSEFLSGLYPPPPVPVANAGAYPAPIPVVAGLGSGGKVKGPNPNGGNLGSNTNKDLHMFVWSSSASPGSEANLRNAVHRAASVDLGGLDTNKTALQGLQASSANASPIRKASGDLEIELDGFKSSAVKIPAPIGSPFMAHQKVVTADDTATVDGVEMAGAGGGRNHQMPPTSVMTRLILIMVWRKLIRNPNTYSSLIGLIWSLVSFRWNIEMPKIIEGSISILSDAGLGMAMFSLGLFMALQPKIIACGKSVAAFSMAVRFLTGPAVIAATSIVIGLRGVLLHVAIVQAALPQGIVPFVFAKEYNCHPDILSTAVIFGMLIALPITILYYILLGV